MNCRKVNSIMDIGFRILKCDLKLKDEAKLKEYAT
jgi:hypothetical protein